MTPRERLVLTELRALDDLALNYAGPWWMPYHVRYFRAMESELASAGVGLDSVRRALRALQKRGLIERAEGRDAEYRITPAGRSALDG